MDLHHLIQRANTTSLWATGNTDGPQQYKSVTSQGPNIYKPGDFHYKYNSHGLRCDEFNLSTDIGIVFLGCSYTEGIGLPLEETWSYKLLTKIRDSTKLRIPYWSLAIGGCGIDTQARYLYRLVNTIKVEYIFSLFPPFHRREYCLLDDSLQMWGPSFGNNPLVDKTFTDNNFSFHQTDRSLMLVESIRKQNNTTMLTSSWNNMMSPNWGNVAEEEQFIKNNYPNLNYFTYSPQSSDLARDGKHTGPKWHSEVAAAYWEKTKHNFE